MVSQLTIHGHQAVCAGLHVDWQLHLRQESAGGKSAEPCRSVATAGNLRPRCAASLQRQQHLGAADREGQGTPLQHAWCCGTPGRRLGAFRHLGIAEWVRSAMGQCNLLRQPREHPASARPAEPGTLVQRRGLRNGFHSPVAKQPGSNLASSLLANPWASHEQCRPGIDQGPRASRKARPSSSGLRRSTSPIIRSSRIRI